MLVGRTTSKQARTVAARPKLLLLPRLSVPLECKSLRLIQPVIRPRRNFRSITRPGRFRCRTSRLWTKVHFFMSTLVIIQTWAGIRLNAFSSVCLDDFAVAARTRQPWPTPARTISARHWRTTVTTTRTGRRRTSFPRFSPSYSSWAPSGTARSC